MKNVKQMNSQSGFTLIELVVVIVILGILAATALPRFIDIGGDARTAAAQGVAGALGSASSMNYSAMIARGRPNNVALDTAVATPNVAPTAGGCTNAVAASLLAGGVVFAADDANAPANSYSVSGPAAIATTGAEVTCTVTHNDDAARTATFILIGAR